ncbi:hypothetical protein NP493_812g02003 [Ridgeia piscesae]|uniref:Uncharacterized protein n=1 Tax=Ridgeia piscesae TaxID=27915 RepID=A0AAD9KN87_RIDPI|nr:hypothetical protein NP493_812g02003 [Ridgeia piscesae]
MMLHWHCRLLAETFHFLITMSNVFIITFVTRYWLYKKK